MPPRLIPGRSIPLVSTVFEIVTVVVADCAAFTVRVALLLVTLPTELETVTENCAPLLEVASVGVV
jgi:hypothetical protein